MIKFNLPIEYKESIINDTFGIMSREFKGKDVGLIYLTEKVLIEMFRNHFDKTGNKYKIHRGWIHFMKEGSERRSHQHTKLTALYYLKIPEGSGELYFDDTAEFFKPKEDDFYIFDSMIRHGITTHKSKDVRLAIAMEIEELK